MKSHRKTPMMSFFSEVQAQCFVKKSIKNEHHHICFSWEVSQNISVIFPVDNFILFYFISKLIFQVLKIILFIACLEWFKSLDFFKNLVIIFTILIIFTIRKVHPATLLNFNTHLGRKIQYQKLVQLWLNW